jgi:hypothetical protein
MPINNQMSAWVIGFRRLHAENPQFSVIPPGEAPYQVRFCQRTSVTLLRYGTAREKQVFYYFSFFELFEITNQPPPRAKVEALLDRGPENGEPRVREDDQGLRPAR